MKLLSREDFKTQVFVRSSGKCIFCHRPAVNAHHIMERKLWANGGFYLANGAGVCNMHHWDCETTRISVEAVRRACGIEEVCLPPGLSPDALYDKWGNRLRADGLREPGPLFEDQGCRKALATGGFLGLFVPKGTELCDTNN